MAKVNNVHSPNITRSVSPSNAYGNSTSIEINLINTHTENAETENGKLPDVVAETKKKPKGAKSSRKRILLLP